MERCGNCAGVWLDAGEWEALKRRNLHDDIEEIFTTAWQTKLEKEASADAADAALRKSLGADDYTEIKRVKAWLAKHPKRSQLLAYLTEG